MVRYKSLVRVIASLTWFNSDQDQRVHQGFATLPDVETTRCSRQVWDSGQLNVGPGHPECGTKCQAPHAWGHPRATCIGPPGSCFERLAPQAWGHSRATSLHHLSGAPSGDVGARRAEGSPACALTAAASVVCGRTRPRSPGRKRCCRTGRRSPGRAADRRASRAIRSARDCLSSRSTRCDAGW